MKHLLIILLLSIGTVAFAQQTPSVLRTRITDDGQTLLIQIDGDTNQGEVHSRQTFDVTGLGKLRKEFILLRAFSTQGVWLSPDHTPRLFGGTVLLVAVLVSLFIKGYQRKKATLMNPVKSLRTE